MSYSILEILLYYATHTLGLLVDTPYNIHNYCPYNGEEDVIIFF